VWEPVYQGAITALSAHVVASNPHGITAGGIGAATTGALAAVAGDLAAHEVASNPHALDAAAVGKPVEIPYPIPTAGINIRSEIPRLFKKISFRSICFTFSLNSCLILSASL
jgi:hypothetical protein